MSEIALLSSIFIFLFLSSHACNARNVRIVDDKSTSTSKIVGSSKMKMDFSADKGTSRDVNVLRSQDEDPVAATQELKESSKIPIEEAKNVKEDKESSAGVSWRLPQKSSSSHGEHPGFNSDYSQPRTRTPCHN